MALIKGFHNLSRQSLAWLALTLACCHLGPWLFPLRVATAEDIEPAPQHGFRLLRYDEDYSYLLDARQRAYWFDRIKYVPLKAGGDLYLSLGGEIRERYEYTRNPAWGQDPQDKCGVFLQRYVLHADLHLTERFRFFGQLASSLASGRERGPSPVDENQLALQQAFFDLSAAPQPDSRLTLRPGRQEVRFGSGRIVDVREGPSVRRRFDAVRSFLENETCRVDGIAARPVEDKRNVFDDDTNDSQALWGLYGVLKHVLIFSGGIDLYYLGFQDEEATYEQGTAKETRHSIGMRLWGIAETGWDYNYEFLYQWGEFGSGRIKAWTAASETGFTWQNAPIKPRFALSANVSSGDRDLSDDDLETFNPLYPRGNYFSELALLGPRNFFNVHPFLTINPVAGFSITTDVNFFWRLSLDDGVYSPSGQLLRPSEGSNARFVGSAISVTNEWQVNRHLLATLIYSHFFPGEFIEETTPSDSINFIELTIQFLF